MNRRITRENHRQENGRRGAGGIRGVYVVRLLVCFLLALNVLLVYAIFFSSHGLPGFMRQKEQVRELEEKIFNLKQENQKLFEMIQAFKNDPKAQEKLVRHELGWVRENEIIVEFPEKDPETRSKPSPDKHPLPAK